MTLEQLYNQLEDLIENQGVDLETEVKLAMQPSWPFEYSISDHIYLHTEEENDRHAQPGDDPKQIIYLAESRQERYLPQEVADNVW